MLNHVATNQFVVFFLELELFLAESFHFLLVLALFKHVCHGVLEAHLDSLLIMLPVLSLYLSLDPLQADVVEVFGAMHAAKYYNKAKLDSNDH